MSEERMRASDFPQEVLALFDKYVHGIIDRRAFFDGAAKFAVGGMTAAAMFESLRPHYAWAQQVPPDDERIEIWRRGPARFAARMYRAVCPSPAATSAGVGPRRSMPMTRVRTVL